MNIIKFLLLFFLKKKITTNIPVRYAYLVIIVYINILFKQKLIFIADGFSVYRLVRICKFLKIYDKTQILIIANLNEKKFYSKSIYYKQKK